MVVVFIGQIMLLSITKIVIHYRHVTRNMRWSIDSVLQDSSRVEGSVGGTTVGLHLSADVIENGGRVLWVGMDMPNPDDFLNYSVIYRRCLHRDFMHDDCWCFG